MLLKTFFSHIFHEHNHKSTIVIEGPAICRVMVPPYRKNLTPRTVGNGFSECRQKVLKDICLKENVIYMIK